MNEKDWNWGLTKNAEILNGRSAMIGFFILMIIELITNKTFLSIKN
jgi:hypothetical protein